MVCDPLLSVAAPELSMSWKIDTGVTSAYNFKLGEYIQLLVHLFSMAGTVNQWTSIRMDPIALFSCNAFVNYRYVFVDVAYSQSHINGLHK